MTQSRFLNSEEYDEDAFRRYDQGDYKGALETLKEGISIYPDAVELHVGMGYARMAREEFAWARASFERALMLEPHHENALVGMGEVLLRFGRKEQAVVLFRQVVAMGYDADIDLMLTIGRALYGAGLYVEARNAFAGLVTARPDSPEALAALGYAVYQTGEEAEAGRLVRRALNMAPELRGARVFLGHLLYEQAEREQALREFERVPPDDHWDSRAVWRIIELNAALKDIPPDDSLMAPWQSRLEELENLWSPLDRLLADVAEEATYRENPASDQMDLFDGHDSRSPEVRHVRTRDGQPFWGTWHEIVRQMRDHGGFSHETVSRYMRRLSDCWLEQFGVEIPAADPKSFLTAAIRAGLVKDEG